MNMAYAFKTIPSTVVTNTQTKCSTPENIRRLDFCITVALILLTILVFANPTRNTAVSQTSQHQAENPVALVTIK